MKILKIAYEWPLPWHALTPHIYELTCAQVKIGHEFDLFCGRWPFAGEIVHVDNVNIVPFMREPIPGTVNLTTSVIMFFCYLGWRAKHKYDLIHSHGHFAIWIYFYRFLLSKIWPWSSELKTPLVVHFHNTVMGRWEAAVKGQKSIKFISKYVAWPLAKFSDILAVKVAKACIFVSEDTRAEAIKFYNADPNKCFVVETGVNTQSFAPIGLEEKEKTRHDLGFDPMDKVIINYGMLLERKNIHLLIEALKFLPSYYKLFLVGTGDVDYIKKLQELIEENGLKNRVVQAEFAPYPQVPIAVQASDIYVLPSSWEGLPKTVVESLAAGIPVLASGFSVKEEIQGLFYLKNLEPENIAMQIKEIIESGVSVDLYKVHKFYSWEEKAQQVEKVYEYVFNS